MPNSNQRSLRAWSISLGPVHTVIVLGIFTGCLACAFLLGFWLGQKLGVETTLSSNLSTAMRLPIDADDESETAAQEAISDVYAKLGSAPSQETGSHRAEKGQRGGKDAMPELGSIKMADRGSLEEAATALGAELPPDKPEGADLSNSGNKLETILGSDKPVVIPGEVKPSARVRVLGDEAPQQGKTLGALAVAVEAGQPSDKTPQAQTKPETKTEKPENAKLAVKLDEPKRETKTAAQEKAIEQAKSEPEAKTKTMPRDTTLVTSAVPTGWYAQIIAPKTQAEAESMARRLKGSGFSVVIENAKVRGEQYFRVLVGPEQNRQQGERLLTQLKRESYLKSAPFLRMVK